ncbi:hypothetical protein DVH24_001515 [Malus domestica]|uniref:Uncharacterized protein n=1 Tax=Malus domestica TaxID=3750 RepID=A0A498K103_MALDO|nr:hypothetical protein DVH24_001515 [Malus domestica]
MRLTERRRDRGRGREREGFGEGKACGLLRGGREGGEDEKQLQQGRSNEDPSAVDSSQSWFSGEFSGRFEVEYLQFILGVYTKIEKAHMNAKARGCTTTWKRYDELGPDKPPYAVKFYNCCGAALPVSMFRMMAIDPCNISLLSFIISFSLASTL